MIRSNKGDKMSTTDLRQTMQLYIDDLNRNEISDLLEVYVSDKTLGKILDVFACIYFS